MENLIWKRYLKWLLSPPLEPGLAYLAPKHCCMRTVRFIPVFCLLFRCTQLSAQQPVFAFQQDDTLLKRKYYNEALKKKDMLLSSLPKDNTKDYKQAYNSMFETVEDLLISSRTVSEEKANNYIRAIVAKIVNANPELKGLDMRVVFSRDYYPNAFSLGDGTIAFNAGLFVYLDNEAEMAFVICHELAHYYLDHSKKRIDKMVRTMNSDSLKEEIKRLRKQQYGVGAQAEKLIRALSFDVRRHSREGETEADRVGLRFLKNTGYTGNGFITCMQKLDKVDDTVLLKEPELSKLLSFPGNPFKERWIKKESVIFGAMNPDDASGLTQKEKDSLKTHPDCSRRIALFTDSARAISGREFLVDEQLFRKLKEDFIPEIVEEVYKAGNVSLNLYLSLCLLQEGQYKPLAIYSVARDLNLIYTYQKDHSLGLFIESENRKYRESYNLLLRMLYRLRLNEIAALNAAFCTYYQDQMKGYDGFGEEMNKAKTFLLSHD